MTKKVSMEALLPLKAERAMYVDFFNVLRPTKELSDVEDTFWRAAKEGLDDPNFDVARLCRLDADPRNFGNAESYYRCAQFAALFRKRDDVGHGTDRLLAALESFISAEKACSRTNTFLWGLRNSQLGEGKTIPVELLKIVHSARSEIRRILGPCPALDELPCYLGPGATTQVVRKQANARVKLGQSFACSESMLPWIDKILETMPDFIFRHCDGGESATVRVEVHPARLSFVPKNFKTYRSIAVEPWLNSFYQLGIGVAMTRRLRSFGLDLADQSANAELARKGSIDDSLSTIDLSSASDCIAIELVRELLPDDWWELCLHTRSSVIEYEGRLAKVEKFSSMGNGFTFPLQSLIFYSLARATARSLGLPVGDIRAYGDDIIVPRQSYGRVVSLLSLLGFKVNTEKSYHTGPFRESCGSDYWLGMDVRPLFIRRRPNYFDLFTLHNGFMRKARPELAEIIRRYIPEPLVLFGPDGYGDGHLIGYPFDPVFKQLHRKNGWAGYVFETYSLKGRRFTRPHPGDYLYPAYSIYRRGEGQPSGSVDTAWASLPGTAGYRKLSIYTLDLASVKAH